MQDGRQIAGDIFKSIFFNENMSFDKNFNYF